MSVNIVVHDLIDGKARTIAWGAGLTVGVDIDGPVRIGGMGHGFRIKETYEEVMALIAAEQRKRDRLMLAGQFMAAYLSDKSQIWGYAAAVHHADALLAALDATGGAE